MTDGIDTKLRMGSASSETFAVWQEIVGDFDAVVTDSKKGASLVALERWWLGVAASSASSASSESSESSESSASRNAFGRDELVQLIKWKGQRGKFRPALVRYAADMDDQALRDAVQAARSLLRKDTDAYIDVDTVEQALEPLLELRGVGPATASAILAAFDDRVPFMADSLLEALHGGVRKYTKASYLDMFRQLQRVQRSVATISDGAWCSLRDMERAVFVDSLRTETNTGRGRSETGPKGAKGAKGKRTGRNDEDKSAKRRRGTRRSTEP